MPQYTSFTDIKGKGPGYEGIEETKESIPNSNNLTGDEENENDLFTHLTYLSQLGNDVQGH